MSVHVACGWCGEPTKRWSAAHDTPMHPECERPYQRAMFGPEGEL